MSIVVKNLTKKYGEQIAVNNISFTINDNEIVGFLGPNGAGKSTTMKMITGYLEKDNGEIKVNETEVSLNSIQTKKRIGYLPESNPLYLEMYVREYLGFIANVHQISDSENRIEEVIQLVGLTPEAHKKIAQLSKGYKQRVGLAAALIHDPEVLILDEPTSGLDPNQIIEIREVIKKLGEKKTILFSSHIMQEVESLCKRVIIINKGNVVADNLLSQLKEGNAETHTVSIQFKEKINETLISTLSEFISYQKTDDFTIIFESKNPEQLRKKILALSINHNLNIISLNSEKNNLEDVFKSLTQ